MDGILKIVTGTPAVSPTLPAGPSSGLFIDLGRVDVPKAGNGSPVITDLRPYTAAAGAPIPVRNATERDALTKTTGLSVRRLDISGAPTQVYDGTNWRTDGVLRPLGHMGKTNGFQSLSGLQTVTMDAAQLLRGGVTFDNANDALVIPIAGLYRVTMQAYFSGTVSGTNVTTLYQNATQTGINTRANAAASDQCATAVGILNCAAGDKIYMQAQTGSQQAWGSNGYNGCFIEVEYIAPPESY